MRLLAILWAEPPTPEDWARLTAAKEAIGYTDLIKPVQALPGSPGVVLAIGDTPSWLCPHEQVSSTEDRAGLERALDSCLRAANDGSDDNYGELYAASLSHWMMVDVKYRGEEEYVKPELGGGS